MLDGHAESAVKVSVAIQCSSCQKWVHKKCSGIKGSMSKVAISTVVVCEAACCMEVRPGL